MIELTQKPICIHTYLTTCKTHRLPPGFGDWLRGTVTLWNYCQEYGFELFINNQVHPIFSHLVENQQFIQNSTIPIEEYFSPMPYETIDIELRKSFERKHTFAVLTNGLYAFITNEYYGPVPEECKKWIRQFLIPNTELEESIQNVYASLGICQPYRVIHLRLGDNYLHQNDFDPAYFQHINQRIQHTLRTESEYQYILLCDTSSFALELKKQNPQLFYWDNKKIHTGEIEFDEKNVGVKDTLVDFFIMTKALHILSIFDSGFSRMISNIYDITYYRI
jgi:hypothetical protein